MNLSNLLSGPAAIIGSTGSGKTFAAKGAVEELLTQDRRVIILDPTGAWWGLRSMSGGQKEGFPILIIGGEHGDIPLTKDTDGKALAEAFAQRQVQAIIDTSELTGGEKNRFLTPFLEVLYAKNKSVLHLIVDEADEIAAQRLADGEQRLFGVFDKIVRRGRIKGFRPLMITQRPAVIHKNVLSQISTLVALKLMSPQDISAIKDWVKGNADANKAAEVVDSLPSLARGEGWVWSPAEEYLERVKFPQIKTYDSSKTPEIGDTVVEPALSLVDVEELKSTLIQSPEDLPSDKFHIRDIKEANRLGYKAGFDAGYKAANEDEKNAIADAQKAIAEKIQKIRSFVDEISETSTHNLEINALGAVPSPLVASSKKVATQQGDLSQNPFYKSAMEIWPARATWAMLGAICGRKARGGHFNTVKKRLLGDGWLKEIGELIEPISPPETIGKIPADMLEKNLPEPSRKMFSTIRRDPGISKDQLGEALNMKPTGGHWNTGMSLLKKAGLISDSDGLRINPILERADV